MTAPDLSIDFAIAGGLNLHETLHQVRVGPGDPCLRFIDGRAWRATRTPDGPAAQSIQVRPGGCVHVHAWGPGAQWLIERAPALCGAFDDPLAFQPQQPLVRQLAKRHAGLRIGRTDALFEAALGVTLEQRVVTHDAWQSWRGLVYALGEPAPGPLRGLRLPPTPDVIARTPLYVFHRFGIEERRAAILRRLALVAHRVEEAARLPLDDAYARLRSIPGVGPWTAARIGLVALGDADAVVLGDLHLPHLVTRALASEPRGSDERMLELLEPFRGHRGRVIRLLMSAAFADKKR